MSAQDQHQRQEHVRRDHCRAGHPAPTRGRCVASPRHHRPQPDVDEREQRRTAPPGRASASPRPPCASPRAPPTAGAPARSPSTPLPGRRTRAVSTASSALRNRRDSTSRPRHHSAAAHSASSASQPPIATITWKATCTRATGGHRSRGMSSRPVTARGRVAVGEQAQASRDLERVAGLARLGIGHAADAQRRIGLGPEVALEGRQLGRLGARHHAAAPSRRPAAAAAPPAGRPSAAMTNARRWKRVERMAQQEPGVDARDGRRRRRHRRPGACAPPGPGGRTEHRRARVDVDGLAVDQPEAGRGVHPGIGPARRTRPTARRHAATMHAAKTWARGRSLSQP